MHARRAASMTMRSDRLRVPHLASKICPLIRHSYNVHTLLQAIGSELKALCAINNICFCLLQDPWLRNPVMHVLPRMRYRWD